MRGLDLFSGVGGASLAMRSAGVEVAAHAEIEPFPSAVLSQRSPGVPNLGDVKGVTQEAVRALGKLDVVTFGSPCQDWSVAGPRYGFKGERSSLFHEAVRIVRHARPRWAVFENVPGLFSAAGGWDFAAVLDTLADAGALDVAWRVLDARWFGVPQRRRRIFLVCDFAGESAGEILFEPEGVRRDTPPGREAGQDVAGALGGGAEEPSLYACQGNNVGKFGTLRGGNGGLTGGVPFTAGTMTDNGDAHSGFKGADGIVTHALTGEGFDASEDGTGRGTPLVPTGFRNAGRGWWDGDDSASPLGTQGSSIHESNAVAYGINSHAGSDGQASNSGHAKGGPVGLGITENLAPSQRAGRVGAVSAGLAVRRLTPTECERLQGFPDGWTDIPYRGKPAADGPRYRALGNAWAVPCGAWVLKRLAEIHRREAA